MVKGLEYSSFEQYLDFQTEKAKQYILEIRDLVLEIVPDAETIINYNIPAFTLLPGGKRDAQIMVAAFKTHVGLYAHPTTMEHFWERLSDYKKGKGSVQFKLSEPLPGKLISEMIRYRKQLLDSGLKK